MAGHFPANGVFLGWVRRTPCAEGWSTMALPRRRNPPMAGHRTRKTSWPASSQKRLT